jgi:hypothetical protein
MLPLCFKGKGDPGKLPSAAAQQAARQTWESQRRRAGRGLHNSRVAMEEQSKPKNETRRQLEYGSQKVRWAFWLMFGRRRPGM